MILSSVAMGLRVLLMAAEKIVVKLLGDGEGGADENIAATFLFFIIGGLFLLPFGFRHGEIDMSFILPCYVSSLFYTGSSVAYVSSLAKGEASLVTPINSANVFVLLLFSVLFLGEQVTGYKLAGVVIIFVGLSILKRDMSPWHSMKYIFTDGACRLMMVFVVLMSAGRTVDKLFYVRTEPIVYSVAIYFFISLNLAAWLLVKRKTYMIKDTFLKKPKISIVSGAINGFSYLFLLIALNNIDLSIAEPMTQMSMILTLVFAKIIFGEEIKEKIPGSLLILAGGWLLVLSI